VPEEMRAEVAKVVPEAWAETTWGTPSLDLRAAVRAQLEAAGVDEVRVVGPCTHESADLFSHRRDGVTGRMAGVIRCEASWRQVGRVAPAVGKAKDLS
jgi:copper oxidase (laccase) domain-containing protein